VAELQERDAKLVQYLNEAYGKEKELETSLQAHIQMTTRDSYKKRLKTEYWNEAEEIANYKAIEALAEAVGDKETAKLARAHRRQEERMASFLERTIPQLTKDVVRAEIPASQRNGGKRTRRAGARSGGTKAAAKPRASAAAAKPRATKAASKPRSSAGAGRSGKTRAGSRSKA